MPTRTTSKAATGFAALALLIGALAAPPALARETIETGTTAPAASLEGNYLAAYVAGAGRDTAAAAAYYREAIKADPRNAELLERAFVAFLADGLMPEAFKVGERLAARDGSNGLAQLALGVRNIRLKRYDTARTHLARGGRGRQADLTATLLSAWASAGAGDGKRALETVDRLRSERAFTLFRDYHAGLIAELTGNIPEAEKRLKAAYEVERNTLRVVDAYARFESRRGNKEAAIAAYKAFDAMLPRHPVVLQALAELEAGKTLAPLIANAQEGAAEVLYGLGAAGNSTGDELPAIIYLRLALHLAPNHPMALLTLGDTYERMKQFDRSIEVFSRIPKESPLRGTAEISIGTGLEQLDRGAEAATHLEALMKERPDDIEVSMAYANVLRSRKKFAEAAEAYSKAVERIGTPDRGHWILFFYRGSSYERAKQWDKAEADLKRALELVPESQPGGRAQVLNYLAYSWVDMGRNIDESFKMLQRAVELSPRDGMIIDSLGWAYYRLGRYEDAVRELEKAIELKPGDPTINDHLGDAYWRVGRKMEARFQWDHARAMNPEHEELIKILKKIDHGLEDEPNPAAAENVPPATPRADAQKNGG